jgi:hypothetical protein
MEVETWLTAKSGKQDPSVGTAWEPRAEFEYAIHGRLGSSAYLNFEKQPGGDLEFVSPSIELIYRLADTGKIMGDPALYLETRVRRRTGAGTRCSSARDARWIPGI